MTHGTTHDTTDDMKIGEMMKISGMAFRSLGAATAGALAWLAVTSGASSASPQGATRVASAAAETPGSAVETFSYPDAAKIQAEQGIILKRGDGHILLAHCTSATDLIQIMARGKDTVCFRTTGISGYLALEIPAVYNVRGNDYATKVDLTLGDNHTQYDIAKNAWTPVGESTDPQGRNHTLVEIRTSK
ncbi:MULTISPECIES: hypothetical protein [unclassified Streptomyces]|uniref:hypothetical protein n=1 Tax=unclassified Streptomyces TaxID=2593676 RepID=UPI0033A16F61